MAERFVLINTNVSRPPVSPVGLEYLGHSLLEAKIPVEVVDLAFETDWRAALRTSLARIDALAIGISVRNIDDSSFVSRQSFLPWIRQVVDEIKKLTSAPIIAGGVGFSIAPQAVLETIGCQLGIHGDGEQATVLLAKALTGRKDFASLPNVVYQNKGKSFCNPRFDVDTNLYPLPYRSLFANVRYEQFGAMVGVETKRGCSAKCVFCADPVAKGKKMRLRPPEIVVEEISNLIDQGVTWFHLCDSEFNQPRAHAKEVCRAIMAHSLHNKIRWYCYCSPLPFDKELARLMLKAGCAGINFGVDSLCDEQLARLGRKHRLNNVRELLSNLREVGLNYMFDLLIGAPGETIETATTTLEQAQRLGVPLIGIAVGVRVYPDTQLCEMLRHNLSEEGTYPKGDLALQLPTYYLSPALGSEPLALVSELIANDPRFLFLAAPSQKGSYNYAGDQLLCDLIQQGARGAYWDILRSRPR